MAARNAVVLLKELPFLFSANGDKDLNANVSFDTATNRKLG